MPGTVTREVAWPALDAVLGMPGVGPSRTGSVISTIYGDAILPRGGALALPDLLVLMRRLGSNDGVVRTAVSRLARDGVLQGRRVGRNSAYALTEAARAEFLAAVPRIYGAPPGDWDGRLHVVFPEPGADRTALEAGGFALLAPGVLIGPAPPPAGVPTVAGVAAPGTARLLAARAWPLQRSHGQYRAFLKAFAGLNGVVAPTPLDAMAARTAVIHAFRRAALRDPRLPAGLLPLDWPGYAARDLCRRLYAAFSPASERWLDDTGTGSGSLPRGPDPTVRFGLRPQRRR